MATVLSGAGDVNALIWDSENTSVEIEVYFFVHFAVNGHERYVREMRRHIPSRVVTLVFTRMSHDEDADDKKQLFPVP